MKHLRKILRMIKTTLLVYTVLFSVAGTAVLITLCVYLGRPVLEVRKLRTVNPVSTAFMDSYGKNNADSLHQVFIPIDSISPFLKQTVIASEDDGFFLHPGFDVAAILSATEYNQSKNKIKRGASTITQQLAKNLFLNSSRNFKRKYKELAYTILMETFLGKDRILELYLNYAQWGKGIFGCEAAARTFYKKSSADLTFVESVRLAAVLSMPAKLSVWRYDTPYMIKRIAVIANNLYMHKRIDDTTYISLCGRPPQNTNTKSKKGNDPNENAAPSASTSISGQ